MLPAHALAAFAFSVFLCRFAVQCQTFRQHSGSVHVVIWILTGAMVLQYVGQVLHTAHLYTYNQDGVGLQTFDLFAEVLLMTSQVIQVTLLIVIALGYTVIHSTMDELELAKPILLAVSVVHAVLVSISKLYDGTSEKYHENDGMVGWLLLAIRLVLYAWFLFATRASQQKGGFQLQSFLHQFQIAGSVYFLAYPLIFLVVQVCAPYLQHPIMQTGLLAMQTVCNSWLASLFLSRGAYFKTSVLSLPLLPGCTGLRFDKDS